MILISIGPSVDYTSKLAEEVCPYSGPVLVAEDKGSYESYIKRLINSTNIVYKTRHDSTVANDDVAVHLSLAAPEGLLISLIGAAHYLGLSYELHSTVSDRHIERLIEREFDRKFVKHYE